MYHTIARVQHLQMASCQVMLCITSLTHRVVQWHMNHDSARAARLDLTSGLGEAIDTPVCSLSETPSPKQPVHYDRLSDVETLVVAVGCISCSACNDRSTTHRLAGTIA